MKTLVPLTDQISVNVRPSNLTSGGTVSREVTALRSPLTDASIVT